MNNIGHTSSLFVNLSITYAHSFVNSYFFFLLNFFCCSFNESFCCGVNILISPHQILLLFL
ncbi:hypothetical protein [Staphylococcus phage vB_ScaM-V1SC01]|nr:hypothetical protein [Staphylococcus phage vB_ScaM-V1SC01]